METNESECSAVAPHVDLARVAQSLTKAQRRVMCWMSQQWVAYRTYASVVTINGSKVCTEATINVLIGKGLVVKDCPLSWKATEIGRAIRPFVQ
jgi:hypothetical protein